MYFHPMVSMGGGSQDGGRLVKYGVVSRERLKRDLLGWETLYCAGRMHKPVLPLRTDTVDGYDDEVTEWQRTNLRSALATSLLLQPPSPPPPSSTAAADGVYDVPLATLFQTVAGLSYTGDPRMAAGAEDPDKVSKLVRSEGQEARFLELYRSALEELGAEGVVTSSSEKKTTTKIEVDLREDATRRALWRNVPARLHSCRSVANPRRSSPAYAAATIDDGDVRAEVGSLTSGLEGIVGPPARAQSLKGVVTAGLYKSLAYAGAKFAKGALKKGVG